MTDPQRGKHHTAPAPVFRMTPGDMAATFYGMSARAEPTHLVKAMAKSNGLVIAWGDAAGTLQLRGVIDESFCRDGGATIYVNPKGFHYPGDLSHDAPTMMVEGLKVSLVSQYKATPALPPWAIDTRIPHEKFMVLDRGKRFCEGVVFRMVDTGRRTVRRDGQVQPKARRLQRQMPAG